ncbi:MAG: metal-dependent transcriptional regulator [Planctomycetia bacterium]|nr:metal-dependent transcriptional regulator [Planctomycetia bacterium]
MNTSNNTELSESLEDYLEALFCIIDARKVARPKDIVNRLHVTNASVTGALRVLSRLKLIHYSPHDFISFTEEGARVAGEICHRHRKLRSFLSDILHVTPDRADATACKMEHVISDDIIDRLVHLSQFIKSHPQMEKEWTTEFQKGFGTEES